MKFTLVAFVLSFVNSADVVPIDADDTTLSQMTSAQQHLSKRSGKPLKINHMLLDLQEGTVALLQHHKEGQREEATSLQRLRSAQEPQLFQVCAMSGEGDSGEKSDKFAVVESGQQMKVLSSSGDPLGFVTAYEQNSVQEGDCLAFTQSAHWLEDMSRSTVLVKIPVTPVTDAESIVLIQVGSIDEHMPRAIAKVKEAISDIGNAHPFFFGSNSSSALQAAFPLDPIMITNFMSSVGAAADQFISGKKLQKCEQDLVNSGEKFQECEHIFVNSGERIQNCEADVKNYNMAAQYHQGVIDAAERQVAAAEREAEAERNDG